MPAGDAHALVELKLDDVAHEVPVEAIKLLKNNQSSSAAAAALVPYIEVNFYSCRF